MCLVSARCPKESVPATSEPLLDQLWGRKASGKPTSPGVEMRKQLLASVAVAVGPCSLWRIHLAVPEQRLKPAVTKGRG